MKAKERLEVLNAFACKEFENALHLAKEYLNKYENDIFMLIWLGYIYKTLKRYDESIEIYDYVLSIQSTNMQAKLDLLDIYMETNQYELAKPIIDEMYSSPIYKKIIDKKKEKYNSIRTIIYGYLREQQLIKINA